MVRLESSLAAPDRTARDGGPALVAEKRARPVVWWGAVGAGFLALQLYVAAAWILAGDAYKQPMGPDRMDAGAKVLAWILQGASTGALVAVVVYCARRWRRERRMPWDAMLGIGFLCVFWQDTMCNWLRPIFFYNSYMVNLGAWNAHVPGWISPHARNIPEPLLLSGPIYGWWFVVFAAAFCAMARRARRRWPGISKIGLFGLGVVLLGIMDMVLECTFIRGGLFAYSGVIRSVSIWGGKTYQYPMYEAVIVGVFCSIVGLLRLGRDDKGLSVIERGADTIKVSTKGQAAIRTLCFIALSNVMFVVLNVVYVWIGLYVDPTPKYPSYLSNGLCGPTTDVVCPAPGVPIVLPDTKLPLPAQK
ncbi:MAG TPA: spirocyclase AveC family protein [Acidimicrobiia bacterium]|nr:spirocyclase AveC family protein [Acidimicrobiia bacterium]